MTPPRAPSPFLLARSATPLFLVVLSSLAGCSDAEGPVPLAPDGSLAAHEGEGAGSRPGATDLRGTERDPVDRASDPGNAGTLEPDAESHVPTHARRVLVRLLDEGGRPLPFDPEVTESIGIDEVSGWRLRALDLELLGRFEEPAPLPRHRVHARVSDGAGRAVGFLRPGHWHRTGDSTVWSLCIDPSRPVLLAVESHDRPVVMKEWRAGDSDPGDPIELRLGPAAGLATVRVEPRWDRAPRSRTTSVVNSLLVTLYEDRGGVRLREFDLPFDGELPPIELELAPGPYTLQVEPRHALRLCGQADPLRASEVAPGASSIRFEVVAHQRLERVLDLPNRTRVRLSCREWTKLLGQDRVRVEARGSEGRSNWIPCDSVRRLEEMAEVYGKSPIEFEESSLDTSINWPIHHLPPGTWTFRLEVDGVLGPARELDLRPSEAIDVVLEAPGP